MPYVLFKTNVQLSKSEQEVIMSESTGMISRLTGKPESFIMVSFEHSNMMFGGTSEPCAYTCVSSIGAIGGAINGDIVKGISALLEKHAGVAPNRTYVQLVDIKDRNDFGWNGATFA